MYLVFTNVCIVTSCTYLACALYVICKYFLFVHMPCMYIVCSLYILKIGFAQRKCHDVSPGWQAGSVPPIIPASVAQQLVRHNLLLVHLFVTLTKGPAMQHYEIILSKNHTISALMDATFPAIKSTGNIAIPYVITKTVAYIHAPLSTASLYILPTLSTREHLTKRTRYWQL
jgi:hypothetical protein